MKKSLVCFVLFVFFVIPLASFAFSFTDYGKGEEKLSEAQSLFKNGQVEVAREKTKETREFFLKVLADSGQEAKHLKTLEALGYCDWIDGREREAIDNFKRVSLEPETRKRILGFLAGEHNRAVSEKKIQHSFRINRYALELQSDLRVGFALAYLKKGQEFLGKEDFQVAKQYFDEAFRVDQEQAPRIAKILYDYAQSVPGISFRIEIYAITLVYDYSYAKTIVRIVATLARSQKRQDIEPLLQQKFSQSIYASILKEAWPPDYKIYQPQQNAYVFNLGLNEETDHWIRTPRGKITHCEVLYSKESKAELILRSGRIVRFWKGEKLLGDFDEDFKLRSLNNKTTVYLLIK